MTVSVVVAQRYRHLTHQPDPRDSSVDQGRCDPAGGAGLPVGPPAQVVMAMQKAADEPHITRQDGDADLREQLARYLRMDRDRLVLGAGVDPLLRDLLDVVCDPDAPGGSRGNEIVYAAPAADGYPRVIAAVHATPVEVPLARGRQDLTALAAAIDRDRCRAVLVSNPHYPTGSLVAGGELEDFLDWVPAHVLVVLDERNRDYALHPPAITDLPDGLHLDAGQPEREGSRPNLAVLRGWDTHGLGGLPIGYLAADPQLAAMVAKTTVAPAPGRVAQAAARATLDAAVQDQYREIWTALARERARMRDELRARGFTLADSAANFVWIPLAEAAEDFANHCAQHGSRSGIQRRVHVRVYPGHGVLVPVSLPEHNDLVLAAATSYHNPADPVSARPTVGTVAPATRAESGDSGMTSHATHEPVDGHDVGGHNVDGDDGAARAAPVGSLPVLRMDPLDPEPDYKLQLRHGVAWWPDWLPRGAVLVATPELVQEVLKDPVRFSSRNAGGRMTYLPADTPVVRAKAAQLPPEPSLVITADGDGHRRLRRVFGRAFTADAIRARVPSMHSMITTIVERFAGDGHADLHTQLAAPAVAAIVNDIFGFPAAAAERVAGLCRAITTRLTPGLPEQDHLDAFDTMIAFEPYLAALVTLRRNQKQPPACPDLLYHLAHGHDGDTMTSEEIFWHAVVGRVAAEDTTRYALTSAIHLMLRDNTWEAARVADPAARGRIVDHAIEEALRAGPSPHAGLLRETTCEVDLGGHLLPPGTPVFPSLAAANLAPSQNTPERDPMQGRTERDRHHSRGHLAFGYGPHTCVGTHLARTQMSVALDVLLDRLPNLRLADDTQPLPRLRHPLFNGITSLPVTSEPAPRRGTPS